MLIAGAKGHAKEILQLFSQKNELDDLVFFDDISTDLNRLIYEKFKIIKSLDVAKFHFKNHNKNFVLGLGNPKYRKDVALKLIKEGGVLNSIISNTALIGSYNITLNNGINIMNNVMISNDVLVGEGALINAYVSIHHDVEVGDYCEISPFAVILGKAKIGNNTTIGANATVLPNVKIGSNVIVGVGAVVTADLPDNCTAVGVPAKIIKYHV